MKNTIFLMIKCLMGSLLICLISLPAAAQQQTTVLVLPPTIHSAQDMTFLQKGVVDMLSSRLSRGDQVKVVTLDQFSEETGRPEKPEEALALGRKLGVDYVVLQSVTVIGSSLSTDAKVLDVGAGSMALTFSRAGSQQSDVINHVDAFSAQINKTLFGIEPQVSPDSEGRSSPTGSQPKQEKDPIYQHPEKLLSQPGEGYRYPLEGFEGQGAMAFGRFVARSRRLEAQVKGLSAGDVDGDGAVDVVCVDADTVFIYGMVDGQFVKKARIEGGGNYIGVDTADLNDNGRAEIFVTNKATGETALKSFVLEYDGADYKRTDENLRWYFRRIDWPGRGSVLAGQRTGMDDLYSPGIYEMGLSGGTYDGVAKLPLPRELTLFGIAMGDVRSDNADDIVAYSPSDFVQILNSRGDEEWASTERYGGSANIVEIKSKIDPRETETRYMPLRLRLRDVNGDGVQEIFAIKNDISTGRTFKNVRLFKNGRIEALSWDQLGLRPVWRTRDLAKYISDFDLADVDGDGKPELIAAVVQDNSGGFSGGRSYLAVFAIGEVPLSSSQQ